MLGLAAVALLLRHPHDPAGVTAAVVLSLVAAGSAVVHAKRGRAGSLLGSGVAARLALLAAAAGIPEPPQGPAWTLTLGTLGLATVLDPLRHLLARREIPVAAHLARAPRGTSRLPVWLPSTIASVALVAAFVAPALSSRAAAGAALGLAALALGATAAGIASSLGHIRARRRFHGRLASELARVAPVFVVHWDAPTGTAFQLAMWLPHLEALGRPFVVVLRNPATLAEVAPLTSAPVLVCPAMRQMDGVAVPSVRVAFYVNSATSNAHLVRFPEITHIQLNHGDSDKLASTNQAMRMYDHVFVAGQAAVDRFAARGVAMLPGATTIVGRPQVAAIARTARPVHEVDRPSVLYAPTWSGFHADSGYSSLEHGAAIVTALLDRGARVVFRPHPYTGRSKAHARASAEIVALLAAHARATGIPHRHDTGTDNIAATFNDVDALVSDVSSIVTDFLFSEKPVAIVAVGRPGDDAVAGSLVAQVAYVVPASSGGLDGLDTALEGLLGDDPLAAPRRAAREHHLGPFPVEGYAGHFREAALRHM